MLAVRPGPAGPEPVDIPEPDGPGVTVHVRSAGICGSDLHMVSTRATAAVLGHEVAGVLDDGTPVGIDPLLRCGECAACRRGQSQLCGPGAESFLGVARDGGLAERVRVPEQSLVPLPAGLRPEDAALIEPLAVAVHGLNRVPIDPDTRVLVVGGGTIGLLAVAYLRDQGIAVDLQARHPVQRAAGRRFGAGEGIVEGEYGLVVDAAGTSSSLAASTAGAHPGATILELGVPWAPIELTADVLWKELRLVTAKLYAQYGRARELEIAAAFLAMHPEVAEPVITHRYRLDQAADAFAVAGDRAAGAVKVILHP